MALTTNILFNWVGNTAGITSSAAVASKAVAGTGAKFQAVGAGMVTVGKKMSLAALPIIAAFTVGAKSLAENEVLMAQTEAVIKSTGGAANQSAGEVFDLANKISAYSGMAHESIVEGENMLLTFKNIRNEAGEGNDIFDQSTKILADMSVAMGTDMKSGAIQLGKALNDPVAGISALSRVGITFTDEQKEMIKSMVEAGDTADAQRVILAELESQFGGSAAAAGDTMTGQMNIMKNSFEQMARTLAQIVMPILSQLGRWLQSALNWFNNLTPGMKKTISTIAGIAVVVGPVLIIGGKLIGMFKNIGLAFKVMSVFFMANPFVLLIAAVVALVVIIVLNWDKIVTFLKKTWDWIKKTAGAVWNFVKNLLKKALEFIVNLFLNWSLPGLIIKHWDTIKDVFVKAWEFIKDVVKKALDAVVDHFTGVFDSFKNIASKFFEIGKAIITGIINGLGDIASTIFNKLKDGITSAIDKVKGFFGIGSPSRVFAVEVGVPFMEGIAKGVVGEERNTAKVLARTLGRVTRGLRLGAPTSAVGAGAGGLMFSNADMRRLIAAISTGGEQNNTFIVQDPGIAAQLVSIMSHNRALVRGGIRGGAF